MNRVSFGVVLNSIGLPSLSQAENSICIQRPCNRNISGSGRIVTGPSFWNVSQE